MLVIAFYLVMILDIAGYLVPAWVAQAAFRRALLSSGFNRVLYGYVALLSAFALGYLVLTPSDTLVLHLAAQTVAWLTLPFWAVVLVAARQTRSVRIASGPARRPAAFSTARRPDPAP